MSETQFQVGRVYATRGGDRVQIIELGYNAGLSFYPVAGTFLTGEDAGRQNVWTVDGQFDRGGAYPQFNLLPEALPTPTPADDKAELLAALRADKAALLEALEELRSRRASVVSGYDRDGPTWTEKDGRETYNASYVIESAREDAEYARAAIAKAERT